MPRRSAAASPRPGDAETYKKFEAMVLQNFVENMLPKDTGEVYGKGVAGDMWKSLLADKLADAMAERGGIGIADGLLADHYKDGDKTQSDRPAVATVPRRAETDDPEPALDRAGPGDRAQA